MDSHVKLDANLWSALPFELLEIALAYLPFSSFFRFRCVCKRWNSLLSCEGFLKHCKSLPLRSEPCILYPKTNSLVFSDIDRHDCMLLHYDSARGACSNIDLQFLKEHLDTSNGGNHHKVYASDGGLLLIASNQRDRHERFSVCNPLLKCWRQLSILSVAPATHCRIRKLVVDKLTKEYKVIVVTTTRDIHEMRGRTLVYDSISRCWNETGNIPRHPWEVMDQTVVCGNVMYVMVYGMASYLDETILMAYHIGSGVWSEVRIQLPMSLSIWTRHLLMPQRILLENRGRVLLVIVARYNYPSSIAIWELKMGSSAEWKELAASIPDQLIGVMFSDVDRRRSTLQPLFK